MVRMPGLERGLHDQVQHRIKEVLAKSHASFRDSDLAHGLAGAVFC